MQVSCDSIEYIPHSINAECHIKKELNFNIIKFKNLKFNSSTLNKTVEIKGKKFIFQLSQPIFHILTDKSAQFEIINIFDKEIMPFFVYPYKDYKDFDISESNTHIDFMNKKDKIISSIPKKIILDNEGYEKVLDISIYKLYNEDLNLNQDMLHPIGLYNLIFEEAYLIVDELKLIPEQVYLNVGAQLPEWYSSDIVIRNAWNKNTGSLNFIPNIGLRKKDYNLTPLAEVYDDLIRIGVMNFGNRIRKQIKRYDIKTEGIYISRKKTSEVYKKEYEEIFEDIVLNHPGQNNYYTYYTKYFNIENKHDIVDMYENRTVKDEDLIEKFFEQKGFNIVYLEEMTLREQLECLLNTKKIAALTGSGIVNAFICDKETKIFEIMLPKNNIRNFFWAFSPISGCLEEKGLVTSCLGDRNWYQILNKSNTERVFEEYNQILGN